MRKSYCQIKARLEYVYEHEVLTFLDKEIAQIFEEYLGGPVSRTEAWTALKLSIIGNRGGCGGCVPILFHDPRKRRCSH
jgi:hypothetical protein